MKRALLHAAVAAIAAAALTSAGAQNAPATPASQAAGGGAAAQHGAKPVAGKPWAKIGRKATPAEIAAWDIDVRPDFKGLPAGSGSVAKGQDVWEEKCASCHGTFGESGEVFTPIVGGTTKEDIRTGRVANLARPDFPQRTSMMKLSQVSTLWDYINRAMPWNAPKTLSVEEVYATTAYILHLADVVPADFVLSDKNIADVQKRLPNRNGMAFYAGMWSPKGKPDVQGVACMKDCATEMDIRSALPDHARGSHGNLAEQNRVVGPVRGADTTKPPAAEPAKLAVAAASGAAAAATSPPASGTSPAGARNAPAAKPPAQIAKDAACTACHAVDRKLVGPSFKDVAARYRGDAKALELLAQRVRGGAQGVWGPVPMPANSQLKDEEIRSVVKWILDGAS